MLIKTRGILFRTVKYSESSFICDIYTEEKGLQTYIISGVRKRNARISPSLIQVMSLVELVAYFREDKEMHRIKEIRPALVFESIPFDVVKGAVGLFMVELAGKTVKESEGNSGLFKFLFEAFELLDKSEVVAHLPLLFSIQLSRFLGFMPGGDWSEKSPFFDLKEGVFVKEAPEHSYYIKEEESAIFYTLLDLPLEAVSELDLPAITRRRILEKVLDYYKFHVEQFSELNAYEVMKEVFS